MDGVGAFLVAHGLQRSGRGDEGLVADDVEVRGSLRAVAVAVRVAPRRRRVRRQLGRRDQAGRVERHDRALRAAERRERRCEAALRIGRDGRLQLGRMLRRR